ncbi:MAG: molybdopterin-dependent oxidoreductase [Desulfosarcinaceae bacterium]|nr:molybdopterin-dependent oxidoreductase [Desulfosarcinaceae bacterium]
MPAVRFACPLDCYDTCGLVADVQNGRVVRIRGDADHPFTRGKVCIKGKRLLQRQYHPQRLRQPLKRIGDALRPVTWEEALDSLAESLSAIRERLGTTAVLHYAESGHEGLSKRVDHIFFNCYGGVTRPKGSLCWGAGMAAQSFDFGQARSHAPEDIARARVILIWGRNPAATGPHLVPFLKQARRRGARIFLIDPLTTATAGLAEEHLRIRPGTDGALALAMAHLLVNWDLIDKAWLSANTIGWRRFIAALAPYSPKWAARETGLSVETIAAVARAYGETAPAAILLGLGLQRYRNGGQTIRCIDALGALTGNIGRSGGGVSYANRHTSPWISGLVQESALQAENRRSFALPKLAAALTELRDPPIAMAVISKANPLVQAPDTRALTRAFADLPTTVVFDHFLTDTARHADWVLPTTTVLEEADLFFSAMFSPYLLYSPQVVAPPEGVMGEFDVFRQLARRLGLEAYPDMEKERFLERSLLPLTERYGLTLAQLSSAPFALPNTAVPWEDGIFETTSQKYELYSRGAAAVGCDPLPAYHPPRGAMPRFPLRLLTPHRHDSLHSQGFAFEEGMTEAFVHPEELRRHDLLTGTEVRLVGETGSVAVTLHGTPGVPPGVVKVYEGWWHKSGAINRLVGQQLSDMGLQAAYYDAFCRIEAT